MMAGFSFVFLLCPLFVDSSSATFASALLASSLLSFCLRRMVTAKVTERCETGAMNNATNKTFPRGGRGTTAPN